MDRTEAEALVRAKLSPRRYGHAMNVLEMAADLARRCGEDEEKAATAALLLDLCKDCEKPGNALAHAGEAADLMKAAYGIDDEDVLNAVRYHTTGRAHMSTLELIVFLADTLEASRTYEGVERLRALTYEDLRLGALETLRELIEHVKSTGAEPAKDSLDAIAWLEGETEHMPKEEGTKGAVSMSAVVTREREAVAVRPPGDAAAGIALARAIAEAAADKK
jgi:HD superfamily phosphohydrolase YqeK